MQLPGPGVFGPPHDPAEALAVLRRAVELGVDHIDTAQYYGPDVANELIREALRPYPGNLALVSKVGARRDGAGGWLPYDEPDQLRRGIEDNLRSLGVGQLAAVNFRHLIHRAPGAEPGGRRHHAGRAHARGTGSGKAVTDRASRAAAEPPTCARSLANCGAYSGGVR